MLVVALPEGTEVILPGFLRYFPQLMAIPAVSGGEGHHPLHLSCVLTMHPIIHLPYREGIGRGGRITGDLDTDNPALTITCYSKGTVLTQGNKISLDSFEETFPQLKAKVEREAASATVDSTDYEEDDVEAAPTLPTQPPPPPPPPSDRRLRESLALLELEFTEEHTQARLSDSNANSPIQQLRLRSSS
ncbi:hypothetical protein SRHO_G00139610 [Serrasalmus rhombeus]